MQAIKELSSFLNTAHQAICCFKPIGFDSRKAKDLSIGDRITVNNGLVIFEVKELTDTDAICKVLVDGELSNSKSMSFPNKVLNQKYLALLFGIENDIDFIACSFVSRRQDLVDIRDFLRKNGGDQLVITGGIINGESGNTNLIKLETI